MRLIFCSNLYRSNERKGFTDKQTDGFYRLSREILYRTYGKQYKQEIIIPLVQSGIVIINDNYSTGTPEGKAFCKSYKLASEKFVKANVDGVFPFEIIEQIELKSNKAKKLLEIQKIEKSKEQAKSIEWARYNDSVALTEWNHVKKAYKAFEKDFGHIPGVLGVQHFFSAGARNGRVYQTGNTLSKVLRPYWVCPYSGKSLTRVDLTNAWPTLALELFLREREGREGTICVSTFSESPLFTGSNKQRNSQKLCPKWIYPSYPEGPDGKKIKNQMREFLSDPGTRKKYTEAKAWLAENLGTEFLEWVEKARKDKENPLWLQCEKLESELFRSQVYPNIPSDIYWHSEHDGFATTLSEKQIKSLMNAAIEKTLLFVVATYKTDSSEILNIETLDRPKISTNQNEKVITKKMEYPKRMIGESETDYRIFKVDWDWSDETERAALLASREPQKATSTKPEATPVQSVPEATEVIQEAPAIEAKPLKIPEALIKMATSITALPLKSNQSAVVDYLKTPKKMKEIMKHFGQTNQTRFKNNVLMPLVTQGLIKMTIADKPRSSQQMWVAI